MDTIRRRAAAIALATLCIQLALGPVSAARLCADLPHTHRGLPAPDCPMHDQAPEGMLPEGAEAGAATGSEPMAGHHHGHGGHAAPEQQPAATTHVNCECSSELPPLALLDKGICPEPVAAPDATLVAGLVAAAIPSPLNLRLAPAPPPPRLHLL
jgi:hypothetical protein